VLGLHRAVPVEGGIPLLMRIVDSPLNMNIELTPKNAEGLAKYAALGALAVLRCSPARNPDGTDNVTV
jgi:hypothetical protein